jgi:hypothetical protein
VFVVKNVNKASVLALIAILLFVFSCGGEAEKERVRIENEIATIKDSINFIHDKLLCKTSNGKFFSLCPDMIDSAKLVPFGYFYVAGPEEFQNPVTGDVKKVPEGFGSAKFDVYKPEYHKLRYLQVSYVSRLDSLQKYLQSLP